ncbi:LLM class flavin-dependent oxidoreductase [Cellulomonas denverensis]|uniref:LLM class flavin-dependent oxidoreductase n=1 Tax=Cellulomonas denverensis TaxID=264297 RepID=A0A7X6KSS2_9CELL|nr:LLM class flavin-dependent oxidoreductase [Cellulomonas denverensis]NKY21483.1 LLM class flavin-dependent oxidoreductase [Cellulomonas denverensis]GIG26995.1 oxidoreductase [Cellulomonas denverensis]
MVTLGIVANPEIVPPAQVLALARAADTAGIEEMWLWEDCFKESAIASAGAILGATERLRVGLGVLPVPLRNVALTAMEVATLAGMFPGRLVPGLGHGVQDWMGQVGARVGSPLTLLREQVEALRALLRGERVTVDGRYVQLADVALDWPPASAPPVLAAGQGPKTLHLVGQVADGVVLAGTPTPDEVRRALAIVAEGRASVGRSGPVAACVTVVVPPPVRSRGAEATAEYLRAWVDAGATSMPVLQIDADPLPAVAWLGTEVRPLLG